VNGSEYSVRASPAAVDSLISAKITLNTATEPSAG
jgi:hypothetical protein